MELNPDYLKDLDPLTLSNTITLSALVGILVRKGVLSGDELSQEIRRLKAAVGERGEAGAAPER